MNNRPHPDVTKYLSATRGRIAGAMTRLDYRHDRMKSQPGFDVAQNRRQHRRLQYVYNAIKAFQQESCVVSSIPRHKSLRGHMDETDAMIEAADLIPGLWDALDLVAKLS